MARTLSRRRNRPVNPEPEDDDEEEEQETRSRSRRRSRDEDDDRPSRSRRRARDENEDEDNEEDERPARSRRRPRDEEDEDEERPARSRRRASRDDDADDGDERPARSRKAPERKRKRPAREAAGKSSLRDGWGEGKMKSRNFDEERFAVEEDTTYIILFLEDKPIASWQEHFLMELPKGIRKSYTCLEEDCPLDEIGDAAGFRRAFNVAVFDKKGNPVVKYWIASPGILSEIESFAYDDDWTDKNGGLGGNYFKVSKSKGQGKGGAFKYRLDHIKTRDLEDDHDITPLDDDELDELGADFFTKKDVVKIDSRADLEEIAEELMG